MVKSKEAGDSIGAQGLKEDGGTIARHARREAWSAVLPAFTSHRKRILEEIKERVDSDPTDPDIDLPTVPFRRFAARAGRMVRRAVQNEVEVIQRLAESDVVDKLEEGVLVGISNGIKAVLVEKLSKRSTSRKSRNN